MVKEVFWCRSEQRSPTFVHLHDFIKKQNSSLRCRDVEGAVPYNCELRSTAAKSLSLFAGFTLFNGIGKSGAEICSPTPLYCFFYCCVLFYFSAPLEHNSGQLCSFLTPHSSLLTYLTHHLLRHCLFHFLHKLSEHCKCLIDRLSCCHIYTCTLKQ